MDKRRLEAATGSCDATFTRKLLEPNQPIPVELCVSEAISNVATREATRAKKYITPAPAPKTASRCWAVVPAL